LIDPPGDVEQPRSPLRLYEKGVWHPAEQYRGEPDDMLELCLVEVIVAGPRLQFEFEQLLPGGKDPDARDPILDATELQQETRAGTDLLQFAIDDSASLTTAREAVDAILQESGIDDLTRQRTILCISEAVTNMLLHGGGQGSMTLRRLDDRLRVVVADEGPGMNFFNWIEPPTKKGQASMGYGFKIILDYLDAVGLRTGQTGTTLLLDRKTD